MSNVIQVVLSNARHPEYGQFTIPFPIPQDAYDDMVEALKNMEIGDPILQDCHVDELESSYSILKRLEKTNLNLDELDYLAKRLDSFDNGEAAQFQGMACKLGVSNIKDFINLTFCCQQATVITDFSDLDAIGRQHYMTMQGGGCRTEELERLDSQKFALDLILNHTEGSITPYGVVYDNGMKLEPLYDGRHFPCYHYQQDLLAVGLSSGQRPENTGQITWLLLPCSEQQLIQLPKAAPASTDALRIENELALCFNRADINPEYMKTLIMAAAAERYAGLNDPTPAHRLALLRQKLELEPENEETLWELFESAVTHVCIGKGGEISLSQKDQKECAS